MVQDIDTLRAIAPFRVLGQASLELLVRRGVPREYRAGATVWRAGSEAGGLHVLLRGEVRVVRERSGREVVVHRAGPGSTLGEIPIFDGGGYPATLVAETDTRFLVVDRRLLEALVQREPAFAWALLEGLGRRVRNLATRLEAQAVDPVRTRLASVILEQAGRAEGDEFGLGMTQEAMARELGTVREVVSRTLAALVASGVLDRVGRARYRVEDPRALEALAEARWRG